MRKSLMVLVLMITIVSSVWAEKRHQDAEPGAFTLNISGEDVSP